MWLFGVCDGSQLDSIPYWYVLLVTWKGCLLMFDDVSASVGVFSLFQLSKGAESDNVTWDDEIDMSRKPPVKSNTSSGTKMRTVLYGTRQL